MPRSLILFLMAAGILAAILVGVDGHLTVQQMKVTDRIENKIGLVSTIKLRTGDNIYVKTDHGYYRVNYDFADNKVLSYNKISDKLYMQLSEGKK